MPQRNQEMYSNSGVNLVEIWGSWIRVKKNSISTGKFQIFQAILQKNIEFCRQIFENFDFFQVIKKIDLPSKKRPFTAIPLGKLFYFSSKVTTFEHTSLYMIRYNNISRPVHDS